MKKLLFLTFYLLFFISVQTFGQDNAIGLRLGGGSNIGAEISFQTPFLSDRAEIDLGWGGGGDWVSWKLTGLYQWVMPIESGFYWYLGVGPSIGSWEYIGDNLKNKKEGVSLSAALNGGAEYRFSEIPIQISLDVRPEIPLIYRGTYGWWLAVGVRYRF